jgi:predicted transcriptional regulator
MAKPDFTLGFINEQSRLIKLCEALIQTTVFALDIETIDWWNRHQEKIALIQIAFRYKGQVKVAVIDTLADIDLEILRKPLEQPSILKIIHNAAFDATRLAKHCNFQVAPVFDTMFAARRSGERKYSLQAQASIHLNLSLNKSSQNSDWSRRPLDNRQLYYAALDSYSTLLLYENQKARNLTGDYRLKTVVDTSLQGQLPLNNLTVIEPTKSALVSKEDDSTTYGLPDAELNAVAASLLGIVTELPLRYSPNQLSVSLGANRVGMAGWIFDSRLGRDTELDEEMVKIMIADLCHRGLLHITDRRRLKATEAGAKIWQKLKSV